MRSGHSIAYPSPSIRQFCRYALEADGLIVYCLPLNAEERQAMEATIRSPLENPSPAVVAALPRDVLDLKNSLNQLQTSMDEKNQAILSLVEKMTDQVNSLAGSVQKINQTVDSVNTHTDKSSADIRGPSFQRIGAAVVTA